MTKQSDALARSVSRRMPKFFSVGSFLYRRDPILMLRGFALDMPPGGLYVWKYFFPLFGDVEFLHMSLGYRLPNGYVDAAGKSQVQICDEVISLVVDNDNFAEDESLDELIQFSKCQYVSPIVRSNLFRDIDRIRDQSFEDLLSLAAKNRGKLGIVG